MKYVVGVDCGGTKTEAKAYSLKGELIAENQTGFGNLVVDYDTGLSHIKQALDDIFLMLPKNNCQEIVLGVAGIDSGGLHDKLTSDLADYHKHIYLLNDGKLALYSLLKGQDGIAVTAGTGSVVLGLSNNKWFRVGGWGHLFGDEGSAYFIAKSAIQQALNEYDNDQLPSQLSLALFAYFEVDNVFELIKKAYQLNKGELAGAAVVVADLSDKNDDAKKIIQQAGHLLGKDILKIIKKMPELISPIQIGLNGSVVEKNKQVVEAIQETLGKENFTYHLIVKDEACAKGAYYIKKRNDGK